MTRFVDDLLLGPTDSIRVAMKTIDRGAKGVALVVDGDRRLLGTITDGDVRRAILAGLTIEAPLSEVLSRKSLTPYPAPLTAGRNAEPTALLRLMQEHRIRHTPILDEEGRVVELVTLEELLPDTPPTGAAVRAVIMAGGLGARLGELTRETPKPMLPIGEKPLLERTVAQLAAAGVRHVSVATHYLAEKIAAHFSDGSAFGLAIDYIAESSPLGTAGALRLLHDTTEPILVVNGDILTNVDFRSLVSFHREHQADLTIGVRSYEIDVPFGVVECEGAFVRGLVEKPRSRMFVNAGVYLVEPSCLEVAPDGQRFDMTDLIGRLLAEKRRVVSFPIVEYWIDIGRIEDYRQAQRDLAAGEAT